MKACHRCGVTPASYSWDECWNCSAAPRFRDRDRPTRVALLGSAGMAVIWAAAMLWAGSAAG